MPAPVAVILAAGQGTRMRSAVPKVLHPICGRPMALWPVHAALEAGAERGVVVGGAGRALEPLLPPRAELALQKDPPRAGGAGRAAGEHLGEPPTPHLLLHRGRPP